MPQVSIANQIERDVHLTTYQIRVYGETEDAAFLQNGRQRLSELEVHVAQALQLGMKLTGLVELKAAAEKLEGIIQKYSQSVPETVARDGATTTALLELRRMLGNWLENHICTIDRELRKCAGARCATSR